MRLGDDLAIGHLLITYECPHTGRRARTGRYWLMDETEYWRKYEVECSCGYGHVIVVATER